jgi:hypothetical protein
VSEPIHVSGIRIAHIHAERAVQVNRPPSVDGPIEWSRPTRGPTGGKVRLGQGRSGLSYRVEQGREWRVLVIASRGREIVVGSAKLQDHALALAGMWEHAVLSGRLDMD